MGSTDPIIAGMAGRYATALFDLALEQGSMERVEKDLDRFRTMLETSEDLRRLVRDPIFSAEEQSRAMTAVLGRAEIEGITADFFGVITRNRRLNAIADMIRAFQALLARHRGEVSADVTSAIPLRQAQMTALEETLKAAIGHDVAIETHVDPALLGGLVVKVASRMIDSSLRTKLNSLEIAMKEVG